jgi:hypothetical protein
MGLLLAKIITEKEQLIDGMSQPLLPSSVAEKFEKFYIKEYLDRMLREIEST